jgi:hypothetical protein
MSRVRRVKVIFVGAVALVSMLLSTAFPGQAQEPTFVFVPTQQVPLLGPDPIPPGGSGATATCTSGPPFVFTLDSTGNPTPGGNCTQSQEFGPPAGLICDTPTTLFLRFVGGPPGGPTIPDIPLSAFVCRAPPTPAPPTPAPVPEDEQPHHQNHQPKPPLPPTRVGTPITQDAEQQSEAGEIDQSFEVF